MTALFFVGLLGTASTVNAQPRFGALTGIIKDAAKAPLADATVTATQLDGSTVRGTISGSGGIFAFSDLPPGTYAVVAQAPGYSDVTIGSVRVAPGLATRADIAMVAPVAMSAPVTTSSATPAPVTSAPGSQANGPRTETQAASAGQDNFFRRLLTPRQSTRPVLTASLKDATVIGPDKGALGIPPSDKSAVADTQQAPVAAPYAATTPKEGSVIAPPPTPSPAQTAEVDTNTPFADHDWTWLNGNSRQHDTPLDTKYFSGEFRADTFYGIDFNQPRDHSMGGSSEVFRNGEVQLEDLSIGGDFHAGNMRGRVLLLFGMFSATTVRNDASPAVGQWDVRSAYKYVSEAWGGYHFNVNHGLNVDAGIFVSYVGLFGYHNFDNWAYQPSYVSSNTPWFFNGLRMQWFPTQHLKIEPWFINGWQSYNKFNGHPGIGGQIKWTPKAWLAVIGNQYAVGNDNVGLPHRGRYHTDDSVEVKYYDQPKTGNGIDRIAFTFTGDMGCETGDGVTCHGGKGPYDPKTGKGGPKQSFLGWMAYNRWWWHKDIMAFTLGGGQINNPGRYLTLVLPINGADAISGTPYFPAYPGAPFKAYDGTATFDWMPTQFVTFRTEFGYRHANVPYWSGRGGITPPGGNNGFPGQFVCNDGTPSPTPNGCGSVGLWAPDLRRGQAMLSFSIMVKL
jgi:hypothetical protein